MAFKKKNPTRVTHASLRKKVKVYNFFLNDKFGGEVRGRYYTCSY